MAFVQGKLSETRPARSAASGRGRLSRRPPGGGRAFWPRSTSGHALVPDKPRGGEVDAHTRDDPKARRRPRGRVATGHAFRTTN